jgi:hypothetical protein
MFLPWNKNHMQQDKGFFYLRIHIFQFSIVHEEIYNKFMLRNIEQLYLNYPNTYFTATCTLYYFKIIKGYSARSHGFVDVLIKKQERHQVDIMSGKL